MTFYVLGFLHFFLEFNLGLFEKNKNHETSTFDSCKIYGLLVFFKFWKKNFRSTKEPTNNYQFRMISLIFKTPIKGQNWFFDFWKLLVKNINIPLCLPTCSKFQKEKTSEHWFVGVK